MTDEITPEQQAAEEEAIAGLLPVTIDAAATEGGPYRFDLPILKMGRARRWRRLLDETIAGLAVVKEDTPEGNDAMAAAEAALVVAYDQRNILGGAEWLDEHATDEEIDDLYQALVEKSYRFVSSPTAVVVAIARAALAASEWANSTNGPSLDGDLPPTSLTSASPSPSSTSSGGGRRSGKRASILTG